MKQVNRINDFGPDVGEWTTAPTVLNRAIRAREMGLKSTLMNEAEMIDGLIKTIYEMSEKIESLESEIEILKCEVSEI